MELATPARTVCPSASSATSARAHRPRRADPDRQVHINDQTVNDEANAPFGGVGASGNGSRFGGRGQPGRLHRSAVADHAIDDRAVSVLRNEGLRMSRITVLGGTGYAGAALVAEANRRGHSVTSVSRTAPSSPLDEVDYVIGSALDPADSGFGAPPDGCCARRRGATWRHGRKGSGLIEGLIARVDGTALRLGVVGGASSLLVAPEGPRLFEPTNRPPKCDPRLKQECARSSCCRPRRRLSTGST